MKVLTAEEMREVDKTTSERFGVSSSTLMENAGAAVAGFVLGEFPAHRRIAVLCGKGNNGGDGLVAARHLADAGRNVTVLLLGDPADIKGDAREAFVKLPRPPLIAKDEAALESEDIRELLEGAELFLDALVGTGFKPPLRGLPASLVKRINQLSAPVISVDLPSGWDSDSREFDADGAMRSDGVVTFTAPKLAHLFGNITRGGIVVAGIGSPKEAINSQSSLHWAGTAKAITDAPRNPDSNKGMFGHVLVIGGSHAKAGAPAMASLGALRAGAGLVTAAVPQSSLATVAGYQPELMTTALEEVTHGGISRKNAGPERLKALIGKSTVLAVGPGLGQEPETEEFLLGLIEQTDTAMVLDADGLNIAARHPEILDGRRRTLVLTPHPGEMARLIEGAVKDVQANRENIARQFAVQHSLTVVLKGWRTLVAHPDGGSIAVNTTGNPGMAKGGSGDILTGIVAAMLAQYASSGKPEDIARAVEAAVYLHGLAADVAMSRQNEHTLLATDVVSHLFEAFRFRSDDRGGYVWIQGLPRMGR